MITACPLLALSGHAGNGTIPSSHLIGPGTVAQALEALQKGCVPSLLVALGDSGCQHVFKAIHDLPMPFRAALINAAVKCRFCQSKPPFVGGSASGRRATPNKATSCVDD
jgi:hypothetical protein